MLPAKWEMLLLLATIASASAADKLEYNRDVRPILAENCFRCHGPDSAARKAGLRIDIREFAIKKSAIVPGKPDDSESIRRILSDDKKEIMPPPDSHKTLTQLQKDTLVQWIKEGAEYQPHWSFIAPKRPSLQKVQHPEWVRNPIDAFVLHELEKLQLSPAPEADRRTLARRASLDVTGLPPDVIEVEEFVNDSLPDAYERYLDKLLAKPQWGEHRGRYWLDYARYGDTNGIHFDNYREAWAYRDWVIGAFNANQRFDRFTVEQLAGDLLPNASLEQKIASGFNRCNITSNEGGAINEEYLVLYTRDRTEATSQVWLGLTTGCAVCHDHKFDPVSQRDFYQMSAFFNNTNQAAMDGNIKDTPPTIFVPQPKDRKTWDTLTDRLAKLNSQIDVRKRTSRPDFEKWLAVVKPAEIRSRIPTDGLAFHAALDEGKGDKIHVAAAGKSRELTLAKGHIWGEGAIADKALQPSANATEPVVIPEAGDFERNQPFSFGAWVYIGKRNQIGSVFARMDEANGHRGWDMWYENGRIATHLLNRWPDNAIKVVSNVELPIKKWQHVLFTYDGSSKATGFKLYLNGQEQSLAVHADSLKDTTRTTVPLKLGQRHQAGKLDKFLVQDLRIYNRTIAANDAATIPGAARAAYLASKRLRPAASPVASTKKDESSKAIVKNNVSTKAKKKVAAKQLARTIEETDELFTWWIGGIDKPYQDLHVQLTQAERAKSDLEMRGTKAHVMYEKPEAPMAFVLNRGEYDQRRDKVDARTPAALPPMPADLPRNRLGFAQWLLRPENPLTSRVTVNRFWQEVFGTGLVRTVGDFGIAGDLPSHPELLDWLAVDFRESGWDVKRLFKLMLTSATYRQSAQTSKEKLEKDPSNRLLSRGPRFRMDAEMVRDYALAASGLLVKKIGGPSVKPYQPDGIWEAVAMMESNTRYYKRDSGENLYRRSMYTLWKRAAPPASMDIFNAPSREFTCVRRERTNTPLQALMTMNDPTFVEAAKILAQRALKEAGENNDKAFDFLARSLLARPLSKEETAIVQTSLSDVSAYYRNKPEDAKKLLATGEAKVDAKANPVQLAAWTMVTNQLMNLDEVLNK